MKKTLDLNAQLCERERERERERGTPTTRLTSSYFSKNWGEWQM